MIKPRIIPATHDGTPEGRPVLYSNEYLEVKKANMGVYNFSCQMLCDPKAEKDMGFKTQWLRYWTPPAEIHKSRQALNIYLVADPANSKKQGADYTPMWVIGLGPDRNYYVLDFIRDRLNLTERQTFCSGSTASTGLCKWGMSSTVCRRTLTISKRR